MSLLALHRTRHAKQWATKLRLEVGKEKVHKLVEMCSLPDLITFTPPLTPQGLFKDRNGLIPVWRPLQCFTWASAGSHLDAQRHPGTSSALEGADDQGDLRIFCFLVVHLTTQLGFFVPTHPSCPCFHTAASTKECPLHELCMTQLRHITLGYGLECSSFFWHAMCLRG